MVFNNEQIIFSIPSLKIEWILPVVISFDESKKCFFVANEFSDINGCQLFRATIFHTIRGDISRFDVTCRDFTNYDNRFKKTLKPIFEKFCNDNLIELKFDYIHYE